MRKLTLVAVFLAVAPLVVASEEDDVTSLSYISYLERYATVQPSNEEEGLEAVINMPLVPGDRVDTAREARMEIYLADSNSMWLDEYTTLSLDAVAFSRDTGGDRTVLFLAEGTIMFEVSEHSSSSEPVRIDGRSATVYLNGQGLYRISALADGGLRLEVWEGLAEASTSAGGVLLKSEKAVEVGGGQITEQQSQITWGDDFAGWVQQRRQTLKGDTSQHVDARYERQAGQLDNYGNWVYLSDSNSWAWQPTVSQGWRPFTAGRWYWTPTGYSWLSYEPWGWLPYHYGSWNLHVSFGWVWSWDPYWSPAWVRWTWWPGYVGWCPWGYYSSWYWPRYGHHYPSHPIDPGYGNQPPRRDVVPHSNARVAPPGEGRIASADRGARIDPRGGSDVSTLARTEPGGATGVGGAVGRGEPGAGGVRTTARHQPADLAFDMTGQVEIGAMDRTAWNVVADRDFANPDLNRYVQSGEVAMRGREGQTGVVMSRPLTTSSRSSERPAREIEQVFREVRDRYPNDLSRVLARDESLSGEEARRLVQPSSRAAASRGGSAATSSSDRPPTLNATAASPMYSASGGDSPDGQTSADRYNASMRVDPFQSSISSRDQRSTAGYRNPFVVHSRPSTQAAPNSTSNSGVRGAPASSPQNPSGATSPPSTSRRPSTSYRPPTVDRSPSAPTTTTSGRPATPGGSTTSRRPIVVPRPSSSQPGRSGASGSVSRPPSTVRRPPSTSSRSRSVPRVSSPSRPSSGSRPSTGARSPSRYSRPSSPSTRAPSTSSGRSSPSVRAPSSSRSARPPSGGSRSSGASSRPSGGSSRSSSSSSGATRR